MVESSLQPLNILGESLNHIIAEQIAPGVFQEIDSQLRYAQEKLRSVGSAGVSGIISVLEQASAKAGEAIASQLAAREGIASYAANAGFVGVYKPDLLSLTEPPPDRSSIFQERPDSGDHFYAVGIDGTVRPRDILTNEVIFPDAIPEGLLLDEELRRGFDFWMSQGDRVPFRLLLSAHHTDQDLLCAGIDLRREAQQLRSAQGVLFVEFVASRELSMGMQQLYNSASRSQSLGNQELSRRLRNGTNSGFTNDTLAKIEGTDVDILVPDYCEDSDRPADIALSLWSEVLDLSILNIDSEESYLRYKNLLLGYIFYRDFYLVGKMGAEMSKRANGSNAATGASLLVGRLHENIGTILRKMGVEVTAVGNRANGHWSTRLMVDCVRRGAIRIQDAERLAHDET